MLINNFLANQMINIEFKLLIIHSAIFWLNVQKQNEFILIKYRKNILKVINNYRFPDFLFL